MWIIISYLSAFWKFVIGNLLRFFSFFLICFFLFLYIYNDVNNTNVQRPLNNISPRRVHISVYNVGITSVSFVHFIEKYLRFRILILYFKRKKKSQFLYSFIFKEVFHRLWRTISCIICKYFFFLFFFFFYSLLLIFFLYYNLNTNTNIVFYTTIISYLL